MKQSAGSNNALKGGINGGNMPLTLSHRAEESPEKLRREIGCFLPKNGMKNSLKQEKEVVHNSLTANLRTKWNKLLVKHSF
jgi:hypothetical protein